MKFKNKNFRVRAYCKDNIIFINAEDTAREFGFIKNNRVDINKLNRYAIEFGYPKVEEYIEETLFLMLGMRAEKKEVVENPDKEIMELFEKHKKKKEEKDKKEATYFEEQVREVIHMRKCSYNDVKDWTVFQLLDAYITYNYIESNNLSLQSLITHGGDAKKIESWIDKTKIKRD